MDSAKIEAYIQESIQTVDEGKEIKPVKKEVIPPSGLLQEALRSDKVFHEHFNALTPGKQKEYIQYISEAKQEKTKLSRLEKIRPMIIANKGLNDKYK